MPLPTEPRAVVTGAAGGLGRALALELARMRGRVVVADIDEDGARETVRLVKEAGGDAHPFRCDVSRSPEVEALLGEAERAFGGVDLLVNNAGVAVSGQVGKIPLSDWEWIFGINLWGVIYGCHHFVPHFKKQGSGHILNVASTAGLVSSPQIGPYNVTKAGVVALSETLAGELKRDNIGVTVLCPTFFRTNIAKSGRTQGHARGAFIEKMMARAKVQADGVARAALDGVSHGKLYVLPHDDGRWLWRTKRAAPGMFYEMLMAKLDGLMR
jgi:NAD(P)-dependent dehydrogenase (short-subunit alcohol dehydrogenase family)